VDHCLLARGIPQVDAFRLKDLQAGVPKVERGVCKDLQSLGAAGICVGQEKTHPLFFEGDGPGRAAELDGLEDELGS
jgi:hypothetical protein